MKMYVTRRYANQLEKRIAKLQGENDSLLNQISDDNVSKLTIGVVSFLVGGVVSFVITFFLMR